LKSCDRNENQDLLSIFKWHNVLEVVEILGNGQTRVLPAGPLDREKCKISSNRGGIGRRNRDTIQTNFLDTSVATIETFQVK
jgi:hypothetical protein